MKTRRLLSFIAAALIVVSGCASTSNELKVVNGEFVYPPMTILSDQPFVWDDSQSHAMNVVRMAQPAGIGLTLVDRDDGKNATIGDYSAASGLLDAGLGLFSSGLFTVVQGESLRAGVNSKARFMPTIVDVLDKKLVYENGQPSYKKVRDYVGNKVMLAVSKAHPDIEWGGIYSIYDGNRKNDLVLVIKDEANCKKSMVMVTGDKNANPFVSRNLAESFVDGRNEVVDYCLLGFKLYTTATNNNGGIIVAAELKFGPYFIEALTQHYDGYTIIPDYFSYNSKYSVKTDYAFVSNNGEELLFKKP